MGTHSPPTSDVSGSNPEPYVDKLVVAYLWLAVYSTEPWPTVCTGFLFPQNYPSLHDLYSVESDKKRDVPDLDRPWTILMTNVFVL